MFVTLTNVQKGEAVPLLQPIDNRAGALQVAVRSFTYWVGWHNLGARDSVSWQEKGESRTLWFTSGLYSYQLFEDTVTSTFPDLYMDVGKGDGVVTFKVPNGVKLRLSTVCSKLLGIQDEGWLEAGLYRGDRPVDFAPVKSIHLYLGQLSTTLNVVDGAPSQLLGMFPAHCVPFGTAETLNPRPEFKRLAAGTITELDARVTDDKGQPIDNHNLPVTVTLEIVEP